jgi:hypothetical protein
MPVDRSIDAQHPNLAERKRIADEQQKSYEKRSKRADKIRQIEAYYKDLTK